jgi:hypothetical protein
MKMKFNSPCHVPLAVGFSVWLLLLPQLHGDYGDYDPTRPAWLDQNLTSANGDFVVWYVEDDHHFSSYAGGADTDGDGLPDSWEQLFWGNLGQGANSDPDADLYTNLQEYQGGSYPTENYFRPLDTVPRVVNAQGENIAIRDVVDTLLFCQGQYASWSFNAPYGLPLGVLIRYTGYGGWGSVNPLWCSPDIISDMADPDRRGVSIHELFHNVQKAYPDVPRDTKWFIEGSARMSEDHFFTDGDHDPNTLYCREINGFLANPEATNLFGRSYNAVFFWKYLVEQTGYSIVGQPWEGFDAMDRFMKAAKDREGENAVQNYLNGLPSSHTWWRADFSRFFSAWITALYTRQFNAASLSPVYYYRDEQENLPTSRLRPVNIANCLYNAGTQSYVPEAIPANGTVLHNDANDATWTQNLGPWRSRYYAFKPAATSRFVVVWVDGKAGQRNYYATATVRGRDVTALDFTFGEDLQRAYYNPPLDEVGVVIGSLGQAADYDLMVWALTEFRLNIVYPRELEKERVRIPSAGETANFLVRLQVIAYKAENPDDDYYVDGLAPDLFQVTVNAANARVISGSQVGTEYWLTCEAPTLPAGEYNLQVTLIDQSDLEIKALQYVEAPHVNRMVVIDRSGSMGSELMGNNEKMLAAKSGGRLYTDLLVRDDMIGLVSFGGDDDGTEDDATLHQVLAGASDAYKTTVKNSINNNIPDDPSKYEHTAMGQGLKKAYEQLSTRGRVDDDWRIALLTDGLQDIPPYWADAGVSNVIVASKVKVDTIALGYGAHESLLQSIARDTEGDYFFVPVPTASGASGPQALAAGVDPIVENHVANIYRLINERDTGYSRIWSEEGVVDRTSREIRFRVYEGMANLLLSVNWPSRSKIELKLADPGNNNVAARVVDRSHALFDLPIKPGIWSLTLDSVETVPYLVVLTGRGNLDSRLFFTQPDHSDHLGAVQRINLTLLRKNAPLLGASVQALITLPSGDVATLALLDGGDHGDLNAGDGIYSRDFRWTPVAGTYQVKVITEGKDKAGLYRLEDTGFFLIRRDTEVGDRDKDGMPDEWEQRYGLQVGRDDSAEDLDGDGLSNLREFHCGGNPASDDTDHGGTQDGSEFDNGLNLLDFADDLIAPPSSFSANEQPTDDVDPNLAIPKSGENLLYWARGQNYATVDIYRGSSPGGPFLLIAEGVPARERPYSDRRLINNTTYYYRLAAKTSSGIRTRLSEPIAATPKADNLRPWGGLRIRGPRVVTDVAVTLDLWASADTTQLRLGNVGDLTSAPWVPMATVKSWKIAGAEGANYVYVQFKDAADNVSLTFSAAVEYQADSDLDGLGDQWERRFFGNLLVLPNEDPDRDGLSNREEFEWGTHPRQPDTDHDGMPDGYEVKNQFLPYRADDGAADLDRDGSSNREEYIAGTQPDDPQDRLRAELRPVAPATPNWILRWNGVLGRLYTVYFTHNPGTESWTPLSGYVDKPGNGSIMECVIDTRLNGAGGFYRIGVRSGN